jgi:hypothetical protein
MPEFSLVTVIEQFFYLAQYFQQSTNLLAEGLPTDESAYPLAIGAFVLLRPLRNALPALIVPVIDKNKSTAA